MPPRRVSLQARYLAPLIFSLTLGACAARAEGVFPKPNADGTVEVDLTSTNKTLVLMMSGDGGWWGDLEAVLANNLAAQGYAVVGLDTSVWFDSDRPRADITAHVQKLLKTYGARAGATQFVLAGYSFGADLVPLVYNDVSPALRAKMTSLVLIAPERHAATQVTLGERTGLDEGDIDLVPEFARLPTERVLCVYGADEVSETGCTLNAVPPASRVELPGGHHFDDDPEHLLRVVLSGIQRKRAGS